MTFGNRAGRRGRMALIGGLSVLLLGIGGLVAPNAHAIIDGGTGEGEVVSGSAHGDSPYGDNAWLALLNYWPTDKPGSRCTAAVINDGWAITAKHCIDNPLAEIDGPIPGQLQLTFYHRDGGKRIIQVDQVRYEDSHDIALLRLATPYRMDDPEHPRPRSFPLSLVKVPDQSHGVIFGFGQTCTSCDLSPTPKAAGVDTKRWQEFIQVNAADVEIEDGSALRRYAAGKCYHGDSGGPLVIDGSIVGISSKFYSEDSCGYAQIANHAGWILESMGF